ncbi:hypothetical protein SAMN04487969_103266 [Paenibacillus algorifonticola]|uniref:Uncharacterized protein n=1 Tax=Paenibacillus algorifonticola TaxID=684063 RepID=A0A1I2BBQ5_9BACL|nr:hypothetical protein SAMN04487969_103266 [Paenibacillus algorifonticola]
MKPGNRRKHGANSCGNIAMFLRDERGERLFFEQTTFSLDRKGLFIFLGMLIITRTRSDSACQSRFQTICRRKKF